MTRCIDHLGIAVRSIEQARKYYEEALGLRCERVEEIPSQRVRTAFFDVGGVHLELLEPTSPDSPVARFLERHGEGIHHVAFAVDDVGASLEQAATAGCRPIDPAPVEGAGGKWVGFLHPKSTHGVLTEFCAPRVIGG